MSATDYAFGSNNKAAQVPDADKLIYQEVYMDLVNSCKTALDPRSLNSQLYVKPQNFSFQKGVRGHRPKTLWCAIRNLNSKDFNEKPQIYSIVSEYGVEIGFAVSITCVVLIIIFIISCWSKLLIGIHLFSLSVVSNLRL